MNPLLVGALLAAGVFGCAVWALVAFWLVPERVSLKDALAMDRTITAAAVRQQEAAGRAGTARSGRAAAWVARVEARLATWRIATPDESLALIEWTRSRFLLTRVTVTLAAVLAGPLVWLFTAVLGAPMSLVVPQLVSLLLGLFAWLLVGAWVERQAAERRAEMREALVSYLTVLALYKASGEGMVSTLQQAAAESDAWTFRRIDARLSASLRAGLSPQAGLRQLAADLGIREISDVADIAQTASAEGAGVFTTLLARAQALRSQLQADAEADANANSARLGVPKALLVMTGVAFLVYPLVLQISG